MSLLKEYIIDLFCRAKDPEKGTMRGDQPSSVDPVNPCKGPAKIFEPGGETIDRRDRVQLLVLTVVGIQIVFWLYWLISAIRTRSTYKRKQSNRFLLPVLPFLVLIGIFLSEEVSSDLMQLRVIPDGIAPGLLGIVITVIGLGFAVWARIHLGKNWSSGPGIKVDHTLIRTGPYQFVRNPIYTGILFGYAGTAIVIGELWAFCMVLFILAVILMKIQAEEKFLLDEFGEAYIQYRKEVKALIPYLL
jgi:protein-S-isoprenylcysteine O-methyltransferase Ste14